MRPVDLEGQALLVDPQLPARLVDPPVPAHPSHPVHRENPQDPPAPEFPERLELHRRPVFLERPERHLLREVRLGLRDQRARVHLEAPARPRPAKWVWNNQR